MTEFMAQIKQRQADRAAQWLASSCQRYGVEAADVIAAIGGDFEQYWTDWAPKDCMDVIGYWKPAVHQAAEALKIRKERGAVMAAREAHARKMGGCVCQRCQGAGGHRQWPGYTCFECGGTGYTKAAAQ